MPDASQFTQIKRLQTSSVADQNADRNKFRAPRVFDGWNSGQLINYGSNALVSNKFRPIFGYKWLVSTFFNSAAYSGAVTLALDSSGNIYAGFANSARLLKLSPNGQILLDIGAAANAINIRGSFLYVSSNNYIERRNISDLALNNTGYTNITTSAAGTSRTVAINTAGTHIFYVDAGTSRLHRSPIAGGVNAGTTKNISNAEINTVNGLVIRASGGVDYAYVVETGGRIVGRYNISDLSAGSPIIPREVFAGAASQPSGFAGDGLFRTNTAIRFNNPRGIGFDPDGNAYISDTGNNRIRRVDVVTGIITTFAGTGTASSTGNGGEALQATFNGPRSIIFSSNGNIMYVPEFDSTTSDIRAITSTFSRLN
jgi:hypothetical protein